MPTKIQYSEADFPSDFPWKVSLKILNSGIILNTSPYKSSATKFCLFVWFDSLRPGQ